jgi:hypothetical protein
LKYQFDLAVLDLTVPEFPINSSADLFSSTPPFRRISYADSRAALGLSNLVLPAAARAIASGVNWSAFTRWRTLEIRSSHDNRAPHGVAIQIYPFDVVIDELLLIS